jgi:transcriptional regulator with XRE-family HTH domain
MGRPPKNPNHALTRLREKISTKNQAVTREMLAERAGISAPTVRDIETGRFQLTEAVAQRIMLVTGVSPESLIKGEDPLKDVFGRELSPKSRDELFSMEISHQRALSMEHMIKFALEATSERKRSVIFGELFREWLPKALTTIGALSTMKKVLTRNLGAFDPEQLPAALWPKDPKTRQMWKNASDELIRTVVQEMGDPDQVFDAVKWAKVYRNVLESGKLRKKEGKE